MNSLIGAGLTVLRQAGQGDTPLPYTPYLHTGANIFDFVDQNPVLQSSFKSRLYAYKKMGIIKTEAACVGA
ncbi:MAG: hypothetical protein HQK99_16250 [Nitrospirae bacterium]|nr:hypothetical protein [Nitrospirota bacterium]